MTEKLQDTELEVKQEQLILINEYLKLKVKIASSLDRVL